jgi:transcriptional regulator with XRE-family HTH domain
MRDKQEQSFTEWFDEYLHADPHFAQRVEEALQEMRIEQDLVALREAKGISQKQLAQTLGVSQPAIAKLESGKAKNLELRTLIRTAFALGASVDIQIHPGREMRHVYKKAAARPKRSRPARRRALS